MRRLVNVLIWLALTAEIEGTTFSGMWTTPLTTIGTLLFKPIMHVVIWDVLILIVLGMSLRLRGPRVPTVARSIKICGAALLGSWVWGVFRGGSAYQSIFQLHSFVIGLFVASLIANTYRTAADVASLGWVVASACVYRSLACIAFYLLVAKDMAEPPIAMTDHCDTVLFVVGLFVLIVNALERRKVRTWLWACLLAVPILVAIVVNNRRLAWLAAGLGFFLIYLLLPKGKLRRRINLTLAVISPFLAAYVAIGWGNPTGIFKPVGSISTMFGDHQDMSSLMRDIENYNLLVTLRSSPIVGVGFGAAYIEELRAIDISSIFPQYRYLPHNSLLGVIAFTGMLGFAGIWQMVVSAVYLHILVYRGTKQAVPRIASIVCLIAILVIELQMWGDIGFNHQAVCVMLAIAVGLTARLPIIAGTWPVAAAKAPAGSTAEPPLAAAAGAAQ